MSTPSAVSEVRSFSLTSDMRPGPVDNLGWNEGRVFAWNDRGGGSGSST